MYSSETNAHAIKVDLVDHHARAFVEVMVLGVKHSTRWEVSVA